MDNSAELIRSFIIAYSLVAKKVAEKQINFIHIDFDHEQNSINKLKKGFQEFLANPSKDKLKNFWHKENLWSAIRSVTAEKLIEKSSLDNVAAIMHEINGADQYNQDWEERLGAQSSLREFWGKIKGQPIENGCADNALVFLGYPRPRNYTEFRNSYSNFREKYQEALDNVQVTSYPIEIEIDQFFNFLDKTNDADLVDQKIAPLDKDLDPTFAVIPGGVI